MLRSRMLLCLTSLRQAIWAAAFTFLAAAAVHAQGPQPGPKLSAPDRLLAHDIFKQLIEINSTDSAGSVTAAAQAMQGRLLAAGFAPEDAQLLGPNDRKMNLVARVHGRPGSTLKPVLVICHLDVVEANRADWTTDPFVFTEKDGFFYGRGTQDVKDGDAALMASLIMMRRAGYVPDREITVALTADEEGGKSNGVDWLIQHHPELMQAAFVINPDAGGISADHGKPVEFDVEAVEKTYADFRVTATNRGGHSSLPRPDNAIYELIAALTRLENSPFPVELNPITRAYFARMSTLEHGPGAADMAAIARDPNDAAAAGRLSADPEYNSILHTTCVTTMMSAGHAPNALPGHADANVNCRILPGHSGEETRQRLIRIFNDPKLTVEYVSDAGMVTPQGPTRTSAPPPPVNQTVQTALEHVVNELWPGLPIVPTQESGASDSIYTTAFGIPSYGLSGFQIDADDVRAHGRDERLGQDSFYKGVEFMYLFLQALTRGGVEATIVQ